MQRVEFALSGSQKLSRVYAIWWDMINTGVAVFFLALVFVAFSIILIAGRLELLPLQDTLWKQFTDTVPPQKQTEIGIGILSVTISAASAAALYLIRIGTARWAMNRRIGHIHSYFGEAILWRCNDSDWNHDTLCVVISSFVTSSLNIFEQISETHPRAQVFFEEARMKSHIMLRDPHAGNLDAISIAVDLFCAAVLCQKRIRLPLEAQHIAGLIKHRLNEI